MWRFALEEGYDQNGRSAVWAIELAWCKRMALTQIREQNAELVLDEDESLGKPDLFHSAFPTEPGVSSQLTLGAPMQPFRMNERLSIQQGLFLCPGNITVGVEVNLLTYEKYSFMDKVHKIEIPNTLRIEILTALNKMNINRATLFPGLDGFAQTPRSNVEIATGIGRLSTEIK